jgi:Family of unknown function (DUF5670)
MLWIAVLVLLFVWVVGVATSHTLSGYINVLYVLASILALIGVVLKRRVV